MCTYIYTRNSNRISIVLGGVCLSTYASCISKLLTITICLFSLRLVKNKILSLYFSHSNWTYKQGNNKTVGTKYIYNNINNWSWGENNTVRSLYTHLMEDNVWFVFFFSNFLLKSSD